MKINFAKQAVPSSGTVVAFVGEGKLLSATAQMLDKETAGAVERAIAGSRFVGKKEQSLVINAPSGLGVSRILLVGLGKQADLTSNAAQNLGGVIMALLLPNPDAEATIFIDPGEECPLKPAEFAANLALGAKLRSYRFDKYRTKEKPEDKPALEKLNILLGESTAAKKAYVPLQELAEGIFLARDLVSEPGNIIYPESLVERARELRKLGVEVEVLNEKDMRKLGMGALLGVGQGSKKESQLLIMRWNGSADKEEEPLAFVGKGVTFDTGGISLKPAANMEDMKYDMAGSAAVVGLMRTLAGRKARVNVVGIAGLVENMPSGAAQRPGDVVTSMSGQTIEVINTDAEGRLVLADALWYCQAIFKPKFMIDLATLTGAMVISLGEGEYAGLFANNDELADKLLAASKTVGEGLWRFPMGDNYDKMIKSDIADMKNVSDGRGAGSITAAQFLKRFVNDVPWAHLDIAGMAWTKKDVPTTPKGAVGFGVRLLNQLVEANYEQ